MKNALQSLPKHSALFVIEHAKYRKARGRRPSATFGSILDPQRALEAAEALYHSLPQQFEQDVVCEHNHQLAQRIRESDAGKQIVASGIYILPKIGEHVREKIIHLHPIHQMKVAWAYIISSNRHTYIAQYAGKEEVPPPGSSSDEWLEWAAKKAA